MCVLPIVYHISQQHLCKSSRQATNRKYLQTSTTPLPLYAQDAEHSK